MSRQAKVHEKHQPDTTQEPSALNHDENSCSNEKNFKSVNRESRKRSHHSSSTKPDDIPHENHEVKVPKNSEKDDLKAAELDCDADKNSINYLIDDDCLLHIFSFLPIRDLIRIERVCKKWQQISLESWRKVKVVNIYREFEFLTHLQLSHLEQILSRCGNYITGFELSCCQNLVKKNTSHLRKKTQLQADDTMKLINKYCRKLNYLNICYTFKTKESYLNLLDENILKNLISLVIGNDEYDDEKLSDVLKKCVNLKELNLAGYVFTKNELLYLTENITTLAIPYAKAFSDSMLKEVLEKYKNLQNLDISGTSIAPYTLLPFAKQFECLALWGMDNFFQVDINNFHHLKCPNLRLLDVSYNVSLTGKILSVLVTNCPNIEDLHLGKSRGLKDEDFSVLKKLNKLMYLNVCSTCISNKTLIDICETLGKVKKLECSGSRFISATGIIKVIDASPELSFLSVSKSVLTYQLIKSALVSVHKRSKKVDLTICISENNDKILEVKIPDLIEKLHLKNLLSYYNSISHLGDRKNIMRIVYGSSICVCENPQLPKTCFCMNGLNTIAYFG